MKKCELCNYSIPTALQRHHIKPKASNGTNHDCNVITVCSNCHTILTSVTGKLNGEAPSPSDIRKVAQVLNKFAKTLKEKQNIHPAS